MKKNLVIGITGGMGAGKTAVAQLISEKGYAVFSADQIAAQLTATGEPLLRKISAQFGPSALTSDGTLDRSWLRSLISNDPSARIELDRIMHPAIQERSKTLFEEAFLANAPVVFYEAPLLFEAKSDRAMDKVICVWADDELRAKRVQVRDGRPLEEILKLLQGQMPQEEKKKRSHFLIENNGDQESLKKQVENTLKLLMG